MDLDQEQIEDKEKMFFSPGNGNGYVSIILAAT
jgi:hypothetical protein